MQDSMMQGVYVFHVLTEQVNNACLMTKLFPAELVTIITAPMWVEYLLHIHPELRDKEWQFHKNDPPMHYEPDADGAILFTNTFVVPCDKYLASTFPASYLK